MVQHVPDSSPFAAIDRLPPEVVATLLAALERMAVNPEIQRVRQVAWDALAPAPGQRLLDAGCGAGEVARQLARRTGPGGSVVALDYSAATVEVAAGRHDGSAVRYVTGDVAALDFPAGSFDAVRCERVLQHLAEPDRAVAELRRVTRPGGRVCLVDTDWESLVIDGPPEPLLAALREHVYGRVMLHHRNMGRTLRRRLLRAGLHRVTAVPVVCCFTDPAAASAVLPMVDRRVAADAGMVPDDLGGRWFAALDEAAARGEFLAALTIWVATGTVPESA